MTLSYTPNPGIPETIEGTRQALAAIRSPSIPVAPKQNSRQEWCQRIKREDGIESCPLDENLNPIPRFTGKNPSYLGKNGNAYICKHGEFQDRLPTEKESQKHFTNHQTGIGTLGGHNDIIAVDFDSKNYESQKACDIEVERIIELHGLNKGWVEITGGGGWRLLIKPKTPPTFTNFSTTPNGKHIGEALGRGRFTVLAPTIHPNGKPYVRISWGDPVEVESLEAIGIYPSKDEVEQAKQSEKREKLKALDPTYGQPTKPQDNPSDIRNFAHYLESYSEMRDGWASARCPNHNGKSQTSFRVNLSTGQFKSWCGCSLKAIHKSTLAIAQNQGYELPKAKKQAKESEPKKQTPNPTAREDAIFKGLITLRKRKDGEDNIFITKIHEQWLKGKLENLVKPGAINIVIAYKGCGKTEGAKPIVASAEVVYAVFHLVALGKSASNKLGLTWHEENGIKTKIGVTSKSLWKYSPEKLNTPKSALVVDELDAVLEQTFSKLGNSEGLRSASLAVLKADLQATAFGGGKVILMSADITDKEIDYIRAITPKEIPINIIWNIYKPELPTIKQFMGDKPDLLVAELIKELEAIEWDEEGNPKEGIRIADDLKGGIFGAKTIADYVRAKHPEWAKFIWEITSDTSGTPEVTEYLNNIDEASKNTLLLSCSPSVTAGFSITSGHFKITYGLSNGIQTAKDFSQSLVRDRICTDIRIWVAQEGFTYAGNRSLDPKEIKQWYLNNYKANAFHLLSYQPEYNPLKNEWNSPHFELKCQQEAYRNGCMKYLRLRAEQHLRNEGYKIEEYNPCELKPKAEIASANLKVINFENSLTEAKAIATKRLMTENEYQITRESKDPEVLRERAKFRLNKTYGDELATVVAHELPKPGAEDKEDKELLEGYEALYFLDKEGWGGKLKLLHLLAHPDGKEIAAKLDLKPHKDQMYQLNALHLSGERFAGDIQWNSRKLKALQYLEVVSYLKPGEYIKPNQRAKLITKIKKHPDRLKECFVWSIGDDKADGTIFRELFEGHLGLKVLSKQIKGQKGRSQAIDPEYWNYFQLYAKHQNQLYLTDEDMQKVDRATGQKPEEKGNATPSNKLNELVEGGVTEKNGCNPDPATISGYIENSLFEKLETKKPENLIHKSEVISWAIDQGLSEYEADFIYKNLNPKQSRIEKMEEFITSVQTITSPAVTERAIEDLSTVQTHENLAKVIRKFSLETVRDAIDVANDAPTRQRLRKLLDEVESKALPC